MQIQNVKYDFDNIRLVESTLNFKIALILKSKIIIHLVFSLQFPFVSYTHLSYAYNVLKRINDIYKKWL